MESTVLNRDIITLGHEAIGSIGSQGRSLDAEKVNDMRERLKTDEFYVATDLVVPIACIDGRTGEYAVVGPNAAGGTASLAFADALTTDSFRMDNDKSSTHLKQILQHLRSNGYPTGGHCDEHASAPNSGCGACDKLPNILKFISLNGQVIKDKLKQLGVNVDSETHELITDNASSLILNEYASTGAEMTQQMQDDTFVTLLGEHTEIDAVLNFKKGTTLDRTKLEAEFGPDYKVFNVDVWAFDEAASAISSNEQEAASKKTALLYYNLAAAYVLGNKSLGLNVRK